MDNKIIQCSPNVFSIGHDDTTDLVIIVYANRISIIPTNPDISYSLETIEITE